VDWPSPAAATTLPLEVIGAPGVGVAAVIELAAADVEAARASAQAALELVVHNIVAADSAVVIINDAAPVDLTDAKHGLLRRAGGEVSYGAVAIDANALVPGENRLVFRYTRQVEDLAAISGYRVLSAAFALGLSAKRAVLDLPAEDPASWQPVDASAQAFERGRNFFQNISRDEGPACARCHADSGADLQYYAFSTHSIVERAMFHRFSRTEAEDIASYIRSLPVSPEGRPYGAPFQPGSENRGAAGAGYRAVLENDALFAEAAFGTSDSAEPLAWEWPAALDTFRLPAGLELPTWMRWMPRDLRPEWFERQGGALGITERTLAENPSLENAQAFMRAALSVGKELLLQNGDYQAKVEVLRFAAVKLWDWSRKTGFDRADHGIPDGSPAYPYEVGFAFFEAALADALPEASHQTIAWWWAQLSVDPGRGLSNGQRPLNFYDVLLAAESAGLGPAQIEFLHLYGSWEESRGMLVDSWGSAEGPVRLLGVPMRALPPLRRAAILQRFLIREAAFVNAGGTLDASHHAKLTEAWSQGCAELTPAQRAALRSVAPDAVRADLTACN
jgi:hypothetical protein